MNTERLKDFGIGLGFLGLQIVMFRHLRIWDMQPDLIVIYLLWLISKSNRTACLFVAGGLGLLQDAMLDLWGLNMFSKTLMTFMVYNYMPRKENMRLLIWQIFLIVLAAALVHNIIFLGLSVSVEHYTAEHLFWKQWIGNAIYTAVVASFIHLFRTS
ncbi:MAG: rod shape-determining protein MreD [Balneolaceae bacterium]|nr:rod shape-determining protein MreD [Balneolaceae bacterium]